MGIFMLLLLIVVAPIVGMLSVFVFRAAPWPMGVMIFLIGGGGILRIAYALMFESGVKKSLLREDMSSESTANARPIDISKPVNALPPEREIPASVYSQPNSGSRIETSDLEPASVTENTTKLLEKDR